MGTSLPSIARKNTRNSLTYHRLYPARSVAFSPPVLRETPVVKIVASIGIALAAVACTPPSTRIATGLERYGLDSQRSTCVGQRLERNLSLGQLQQLGNAAAAYRRDDPNPSQLTVGDLIRVAGEIKDPRVALEVGKAAAGCGVAP